MSTKERGRTAAHASRTRIVWPILAVAIIAVAGSAWWWARSRQPAPPAVAPVAVASQPATDASRVVGRWLRPDGGYVLEISAWRAGGKLDVGYFNPRPIHVGQAAWTQTSDGLNVFVELRDTGYPGATYALRFDAARDQLIGTYYQPAAAQTFDVEFVRLPAGS